VHGRSFVSDAGAIALVLMPALLTAQQGACPAGGTPVAQLGIERFECITNLSCEINRRTPSGLAHRFSTEPTVWGIDPAGPASGHLRDGDAIVAVDGALITSSEGGRHLANLRAETPLVLRVRRGTEERNVRLVPKVSCATTKLVVGTIGNGPRDRGVQPPRASLGEIDALERLTRTRAAEPRVEFGMDLTCDECGWQVVNDTLVFDAVDPPTVSSVHDGGPAAAAGIRVGDVLLDVNGAPFASRAAGRLLGQVRPGDVISIRVRRGSGTRTVTLTARAPRPRRSF
jgi:S1-C subfamily serine protease